MSDSTTVLQTVIAGAIGGGVSLATLPMLFKGQIRFEREMSAAIKASEDAKTTAETLHAREVERLEAIADRLENELRETKDQLREQFRVNSDQAKEVMNALALIRGIAEIAASERRRSQT